MHKSIERYGKVTFWQVAGKTLNKYKLQWKTEGRYNYIYRTRIMFAETLDAVTAKAMAVFGEKPTLIQRI